MFRFKTIMPGVQHLALLPGDLLNVYLLGEILVDSGANFTSRWLLSALRRSRAAALALTHAHADHQGGAHAICDELDIPLMCGEGDRAAIESGDLTVSFPDPSSRISTIGQLVAGAPHTVARVLREGDRVGDFVVIETPGHTPGHVSLWRERDRVLILGDVLFHRNPATLRRGLQQPFDAITFDSDLNRASARKVARLQPALVCFGHGRPLKDGPEFLRYVSAIEAG
jgi:glyoxylase-like metal-dependent hydrolase (beta-lactamase superfamily II)